MKKITAVLLAALLGAAFLAVAPGGAVLPEEESLVIHKYILDDLAEAGEPGDGTTAVELPAGAKPLAGVVFKVYAIDAAEDDTALLGGAAFTLDDYASPAKLTTAGGAEYALAEAVAATTGDEGTATVSNLAAGLYLVVEQPGDKAASIVEPFIVAVTEGSETPLHVYPKNGDIGVEKTASAASVRVSEEVLWSVLVSVPADIETYQQFDVADVFDSALDYISGSTAVTGLAARDAEGETIAADDYAVDFDSDANGLLVSFGEAGRRAIAAYKFIRIDFTTAVNSRILAKENYTVANTAVVAFKNKYDTDTRQRVSDPAEIHTAAIDLEKVEAAANAPLAGAAFQIATSKENAGAGHYLRKLASADGTFRIVDYGEAGYDGAAAWVETSTVVPTAPYSGKAIVKFEGIKQFKGDDSLTGEYLAYWIVETGAPEGYKPLTAPIEAAFADGNATESNHYTLGGIVVKNAKVTLPVTGGMGAILLTAAGVALIAAAAVLFALSARKKRKPRP